MAGRAGERAWESGQAGGQAGRQAGRQAAPPPTVPVSNSTRSKHLSALPSTRLHMLKALDRHNAVVGALGGGRKVDQVCSDDREIGQAALPARSGQLGTASGRGGT